MTRKWKLFVGAFLCAVASWGQAPQFTLDIEWENSVAYFDDLSDPARLVASPSPVTPAIRNFMPYIAIADIISVNGRPARGSWVFRGRVIQLFSNATPGQAIGDIGRGAIGETHVEILESD